MSKTGGGTGTNGYRVRGVGKAGEAASGQKPEIALTPKSLDTQYGSTELEPDAYDFLTPECQSLKTLDELNKAEAANILLALRWIDRQTPSAAELLTQHYLKDLHRRMFDEVWTWAGKTRSHITNIGVDPGEITENWQMLLGDVEYWIEHQTYPPVEIGVRFHTRLVGIHCFPNGNGRHARIASNKLADAIGCGPERYSWGQRSGAPVEQRKQDYLAGIKIAEAAGDYGPLVEFAVS